MAGGKTMTAEAWFNGLKDINVRTKGLRVSSVIFGLVCLGLIARLWARPEIVIGSYHIGRISSWISIVVAGWLSIWLAKLAGPWFTGSQE
jgi:hypothetical protein